MSHIEYPLAVFKGIFYASIICFSHMLQHILCFNLYKHYFSFNISIYTNIIYLLIFDLDFYIFIKTLTEFQYIIIYIYLNHYVGNYVLNYIIFVCCKLLRLQIKKCKSIGKTHTVLALAFSQLGSLQKQPKLSFSCIFFQRHFIRSK